jgi:hypothetical protein
VKYQLSKRPDLMDEARIVHAETLYRQVLKDVKHSPDIHMSLFRTCMLRTDYDGAIGHIVHALNDCENYTPAMQAIEMLLKADGARDVLYPEEVLRMTSVYEKFRQDYFDFEPSNKDDDSGNGYVHCIISNERVARDRDPKVIE